MAKDTPSSSTSPARRRISGAATAAAELRSKPTRPYPRSTLSPPTTTTTTTIAATTTKVSFLSQTHMVLPPLFVTFQCIKIMLMPTYRSTDFDVHRNWLAITYNLPISEWYFYDMNGRTVHTLDYPPAFAFFQYILACVARISIPVLSNLISEDHSDDGDDMCLQLLPDDNNEPSMACVVFQRSTVIVSDLVLWAGAYFACFAFHYRRHPEQQRPTPNSRPNSNHKKDDDDEDEDDKGKDKNDTTHCGSPLTKDDVGHNNKTNNKRRLPLLNNVQNEYVMTSFLLIVSNPGLLWLDHIHFQYNGMLLGVLLTSLACMMMGNHYATPDVTTATSSSSTPVLTITLFDIYHWASAALFALLLNLKHLYLPLAPLYFCYLLERYCLTSTTKRLRIDKFIWLAIITGTVLIIPWVPFLTVMDSDDQNGNDDDDDDKLLGKINTRQVFQIIQRLFPFGRGLVHDYWAANVWALYSFVGKLWHIGSTTLLSSGMTLPEPSPTVCAVLLFIFIIPGMQFASARLTNRKFIEAVVYVSFSSFMLAYHVHEKAILTTLIPLALLVEPSRRGEYHNILFWHTSIWGLLGLFPLLFRSVELTFKVVSYITYLGLVSVLLHTPPRWTREIQYVTFTFVVIVLLVLEVMPIQGRWEFLPLMLTSVSCAFGLVGCWAMSLWLLAKKDR